MTLPQLLADIATWQQVDYVSPNLQWVEDKPGNCKRYKVHYREVDAQANTALYSSVNIYIVDEGTETEAAYYENNKPKVVIQSVREREAQQEEPLVDPVAR